MMHDDLIKIDKLAQDACFDRKRRGGEYTPLELDEDRGVYKAFLSDWTSDCRTLFYYLLRQEGYKEEHYDAPYHWALSNGRHYVEYVEGDVYVHAIKSKLVTQ